MARMHPGHTDPREPQPGEVIRLLGLDGDPGSLYTRIRQLLSSTSDMILHEIRDDQNIVRIITSDNRVQRTWLEIEP